MTDKKTRRSTDEKIRIILQTFNPETSVAELCRQYNLVPRTVYMWKEKFLAGGRSSLDGSDAARQARYRFQFVIWILGMGIAIFSEIQTRGTTALGSLAYPAGGSPILIGIRACLYHDLEAVPALVSCVRCPIPLRLILDAVDLCLPLLTFRIANLGRHRRLSTYRQSISMKHRDGTGSVSLMVLQKPFILQTPSGHVGWERGA